MAIDSKYLHSDVTNIILQAFYTVRNVLPLQLTLEVYKRALTVEMELLGLNVLCNKQADIVYKDTTVGSLHADLLVNDCVVVNLTLTETISEQADLELKNFLRFTDYEVGLILNFAPDSQHKRLVFTNNLKKN